MEEGSGFECPEVGPEVEIFLSNVDNLGNPIGEWFPVPLDKDPNKPKLSHEIRFKVTNERPKCNVWLYDLLGM